MKYFYNNKLLLLGFTTLLLASCSTTQHTLREPYALVRYQKSEFNYSQQVEGQASSTKILGIDWKRLFNTQQGKVSKSFGAFIYGNVPTSKVEQYALYNLMTNNPGYDLIVYPQYIINTKASGIGLFYKKTDIVAKARLAVSNSLLVNEGESSENVINIAEIENNLSTLQNSYDALMLEMSNLKQSKAAEINEYKQKIVKKETEYKQQIKSAKDAALDAEKAAYNARIEQMDVVLIGLDEPTTPKKPVAPITTSKVSSTVTTKNAPKENPTVSSTVIFAETPSTDRIANSTIDTTASSTVSSTVSFEETPSTDTIASPTIDTTANPTVSSTVSFEETPSTDTIASPTIDTTASATVSPTVETQKTASSQTITNTQNEAKNMATSDTYILVIGSYSTAINAERSIDHFNKTHPALKGQVGMVISGEKYRIGFINFKTRNEAVTYKTNLIKSYPEFKDAWPFKP